MSQNYYKLYIDNVIKLVSTIVIKSEYSASTINDLLIFTYGLDAVDPYDKTTWKYYLNLNGKYHPKDQKIYITSLDNLAKITFDRVTLEDHPATLKAYAFGGRYYTELITMNPQMEQFILGCLLPVSESVSIAAEDGDVLTYSEELVEENEESLIPNITSWIKQYNIRWNNKQFNVTDSLYCAANLGIMYLNLIPLVINLRLAACKTKEAHSYHIRQYLASHGFLDRYIDYLNLKQRLFLYRNIKYIQRNNGKRETFAWLIDKLLTERDIPIAEDSMRHDVSNIASDLYPKIGFRRKDINSVYSPVTKSIPTIDLDELLFREESIARGNRKFTLDAKELILSKFENSLASVVDTKVLESGLVDYTDSEAVSITDMRLNNWLLSASNESYEAVITFKEPITSVDKTLSTFDAYIYWFYCYCKSLDINLVDIPNLLVLKAIDPNPVDITDLEVLVDKKYVRDSSLNNILDTYTHTTSMSSVNSFKLFIDNLYGAYLKQLRIVSNEEHFYSRGLVQNTANRLYINKLIDTNTVLTNINGKTYNGFPEWLADKGLSGTIYSKDQYEQLYLELFKSATGEEYITTKVLGELQRALIKLLGELSSYSIQILTEINERNIRKLNWGAIRIGDYKVQENALHEVLLVNLKPNVVSVSTDNTTHIPVIPIMGNVTSEITDTHVNIIEIPVKPKLIQTHYHEINVGKIVLNPCFGSDPDFIGGIKILDSYQSFYDLSEEEKLTIKDVYYDIFPTDTTIGKANLNLSLFRNSLDSFNILDFNKPKLESFEYRYIPTLTLNGIKISYTSDLEAFNANVGKTRLNAFRLFNQVQVSVAFKNFTGTAIGNGFSANFKDTLAYPHYLHTMVDLGNELAFAIPNFGTGVFNLNALPGQSTDGFILVSGATSHEYKLLGYRYNGDQTVWS